jgi:hypothetical protein
MMRDTTPEERARFAPVAQLPPGVIARLIELSATLPTSAEEIRAMPGIPVREFLGYPKDIVLKDATRPELGCKIV